MTQTLAKYERYEADHRAFESKLASKSPDWIQDLRQRAISRFNELGFPTARRGNEAWKYTNVGPIARAEFNYATNGISSITQDAIRKAAPWHDEWANVVFVNGHYSEAMSSIPSNNIGVSIESLANAIESGDEAVQKHLAQQADFENDGFIALNTAFLSDGAFVDIAKEQSIETPVHLIFVTTGDEAIVSHPRVLVVAERHSKASVIESYVGLGDNRYFTNAVAEYVLEDGAHIEHFRLMAESDNSFHVGVHRVRQVDNTTFNSKVFEKSVGLGRYDLYNSLDGPGSYSDQKGLYMTSGSQHVDNFININHTQPYGTSRLYYKGILTDKSKAVFGGTVWVQPGAIKTDSKQEDKNLVLSPDAEADSKPALFIYADDVVCGHGASAGNIDLDTLFYMRSRGIDLESASRLLIYGFAAEVIETVEIRKLRDFLEKLFLDSLPNYKFEF
jgi:Fe-S cluster assembly protein SufD